MPSLFSVFSEENSMDSCGENKICIKVEKQNPYFFQRYNQNMGENFKCTKDL